VGTGTVVKYDEERGYGFISPDDGGEDLFMHVREVLGAEEEISLHSRVEFDVVGAARGPRATAIRVIGSAPVERRAPAPREADDPDDGVDVLTEAAYTRHITEVLINAVPTVTGTQIIEIRQMMIAFARRHGWVE
jgi:cold shock CspA family protein